MTPVTTRARWARVSMIAALLVGTALPVSAQETIGFTYDGQGRLVKVARSGTINNGTTECYTFDSAGNRTNLNVAAAADCSTSGPISFAISSNGAVTEGANSVFTVTKTGTASGSLSVTYATANGTAVAPGDYTAKSATVLTFLASDVTKTVNVTTIDDTIVESAENFTMSLSAPTGGATITTGTATATINDNDSAPTCGGVTFSIASNGAVTEGANSVLTVTKSGTTSNSCTVSYATANGTAVAPGDYTAKSLTVLTFTSAQTSQTVSVTTIDDSIVESAETFAMNLSAPSGGSTISTGTANATINDNDSSGGACSGVSFSVGDAGTVVEASSLVFTVTKAGTTSSSCSVNYATANGTAFEPADYVAASGTLTFTSTQTSTTVSVVTNSNGLNIEPDESVYLNLTAPTLGAVLGDAQGIGWIADDGLGAGGCPPTCLSPVQSTTPDGTDPAPNTDPAPADPAVPTDPPPDATVPPPGGAS